MLPTLYSRDRCGLCGECLASCPVMKIDQADAARFVERLAAGEYVFEVLDRCTGCMSCISFCPNGAHPYGLLLERYVERYRELGIPQIFCNAMPLRQGPNLWRGLDRWLTDKEREDLAAWSKAPVSEEVLFLGCNQRLTPYIADSRIFDGIKIFTDAGECCGEYYLRLGLVDEARRRAASLAGRFRELGVQRVIAFCPACENTMTNLAPNALGVDYGVEVIGLVEWLSAGVTDGSIDLKRRLSGTVTVQDPCHASGLGAGPVEEVRRLLKLMGLDLREMDGCGDAALCCGLGASLARYKLRDVIRTGVLRARDAGSTGADLTCAWCNGCYMVMNMFRLLYPWTPPVYHLLELLELATGEKPVRKMPARGFQLVAAGLESVARDGFSFARTRI